MQLDRATLPHNPHYPIIPPTHTTPPPRRQDLNFVVERHKMEMAHSDTANPVYGYLPKSTGGQVSAFVRACMCACVPERQPYTLCALRAFETRPNRIR